MKKNCCVADVAHDLIEEADKGILLCSAMPKDTLASFKGLAAGAQTPLKFRMQTAGSQPRRLKLPDFGLTVYRY